MFCFIYFYNNFPLCFLFCKFDKKAVTLEPICNTAEYSLMNTCTKQLQAKGST